MKTLLDILEEQYTQIELIQDRINYLKDNLIQDKTIDNINVINSLLKITNNLDDINDNLNCIETQNYDNIENKTLDFKERINEYKNNKKIINTFLPYMMYYKILLDLENETK